MTKNILLLMMLFMGQNILYAQSLQGFDSGASVGGKRYRILKLDRIPSESEREVLAASGIQLKEYLSDYRYLVAVKGDLPQDQYPEWVPVLSMVPLNQKLSEEIQNGSCGIEDRSVRKLLLQHMPDLSESEFYQLAKEAEVKIISYHPEYRLFYAIVDQVDLNKLAQSPWIQYISCAPAPGEPDDKEGRGLHRVNRVGFNKAENLFLDGRGVKVMVRDDGFVGPHVDFKNRILNDVFGGNGTHGDMVSGILCGAGNIDPLIEGMAPAADLVVINYQDDFLDKTLEYHQKDKVLITNSSYSNGCNAGYTAITQIVDKQIFENPTLLHVFSAGNSNNLDCGYGAGNQWGNITGGHKIGKNVLTCANLQITANIDPSSSRGPTKDGRLSPLISARGTNQLSTQDGNIYQVGGGTSAASPSVAGVATLLYDAYQRLNNQQTPPSALIKAAILNTATDIGTIGPDFIYGFGVIDAYKAYKTIEKKTYDIFDVRHGEQKEMEIQVNEGNAVARFMIYWPEREASLSARKVLINDLNLTVIGPDGKNYQPLVLDPTPSEVSVGAEAQAGVDTLNNVEQVVISFPQAGIYKMRIEGSLVPDNSVRCYALYHLDHEDLVLTSPIGGEKITTLESINIYFTSYNSDSIDVYFSSNAGANWNRIRQTFGTNRLVSWTAPININSDSCMIEIRQGNKTSRSGLFTIAAGVTGMRVSKYCPGEITLSWNLGGRDSFLIYRLGDRYMEPMMVVDTNFAVIPVSPPFSEYWFAVAGYRDGVLSRRNKAISIPDTLVSCLVQNDLSLKTKNNWTSRFFIVCGSETMIRPELIVHNRNVNKVSGFNIEYISAGKLVSEQWDLPLNYKDSVFITLKNGIAIDFEGKKNIPIWIRLQTDENPYNDSSSVLIESQLIKDENGIFPLRETFDQPAAPSEWTVRNAIPVSSWEFNNQIQSDGTFGRTASYNNRTISYFGFPLELYSRTVDLTTSNDPYLYFDYAYHKFGGSFGIPDSLYIEIIPICGADAVAKRIFFSGYTDIFTVDSSRNRNWIPLKASDWKGMTFDLSDYKGKKIMVNFGWIRGLDGHFFLDNINIQERKTETIDISISRDPQDICISRAVNFEATPDPKINLYRWDFGVNATPRIALGPGPHNIKFSSSGSRIITLRLVSTTIDIIKTRELTIYNNPAVSFLYTVDADKRTVRFDNQSTQIQNVLWNFGDGNSSTERNPVHTYSSEELYQVNLQVQNACGSSSQTRTLDLKSSSTGQTEESDILIKPNPVHDVLTIEARRVPDQILLRNIQGLNCPIHVLKADQNQWILSTAHLQDGIYILEWKTDKQVYSRKIVKQ